jgi:hypothetical protein
MTAEIANDDVIRIRVDTDAAVREFMGVLAAQAAEGETRAPANPANRAVFRELAPYRLLEYEYVDAGIGAIEGAFLGFPDGSIYSVADDLPEEAVDAVVADGPAHLPPIHVYIVLAEARPAAAIRSFLAALAGHVGKAIESPLSGSAAGTLTKAQVLERFAARSQGSDGRAYAQLTFNFLPHLLEFASAAERDAFIAWSKDMCAQGFAHIPRPATVAPAGAHAAPLPGPKGEAGQDYWDRVVKAVATAARP